MGAMTPRERIAYASIGVAQGGVFWLAHETWPESTPGRALVMAAVFFAASAGITAQMCWTRRHRARLATLALGIAAPLAAIAAWVWSQVPVTPGTYGGDESRVFTWCAAAFVCLYIAMPFAQIFRRDGRLAFPYRDLFFHAWTNAFVGMLGQIYITVFFALIQLWGGLFELIGIDFFSHVFRSDPFRYFSYPTVFGYGLLVGRENARFPDAGRSAVLAVFRFLMPLLAGIQLLFLAALPFTGLTALWGTGHASALLLGLTAFVVLFVNAVFEDGETAPPSPPALRRLTGAALAALPIVVAIAAYSLWLRVDQYGLSPERVYAIVVCAFGSLFAIGYAAALFRSAGPWLGAIRRVNVALSLAVVAVGVALHTPLLDPLRASARSQVARLLAGRVAVADFDFASLRFHLGHAGDRALDRLAAAHHPDHIAIAQAVRAARALAYYQEKPALAARLRDEDLELLGSLGSVPEGFTEFVGGPERGLRGQCFPGAHCSLFAIDLDGDGAPEHCLVSGETPHGYAPPVRCFAHTAEGWRSIGTLTRDGGAGVDVRALRERGAEAVAPRYRDVRIGEQVYRLAP